MEHVRRVDVFETTQDLVQEIADMIVTKSLWSGEKVGQMIFSQFRAGYDGMVFCSLAVEIRCIFHREGKL